ncbi:MAG TPA: hypothetical protein VEX17_03515 [Bacillales bacterium]|nr:hypothetical protein [Bacillales bacterium]
MEKDNKISKKELIKISSEFKMYADRLMPRGVGEGIVNIKIFLNYINHNSVISDFLENKRIESNIQISSFNSLNLSYLYVEHPNDEITITHQFLQYGVEKISGKYRDYETLANKAGFCRGFCTLSEHLENLNEFYFTIIKPFVCHIELYLNKLLIDWGDDENLKSIINLYGDNYGDNLGANMNNPINNNQSNSSIGVGFNNANIHTKKLAGTIYEAQKQNLADAAAEIRQLLEELSQTYPTSTTGQKMEVAAKAIDRIESGPMWKQRAINALTEGGLAAFEKAIDNPIGAFVVGGIKGWQETEVQ